MRGSNKVPVYTIDPDDLISAPQIEDSCKYEVYYYDRIDKYKSMVVIKAAPDQELLTVIRYTLVLEHLWWTTGLGYPPFDLPELFPAFIRRTKTELKLTEPVLDIFDVIENIMTPDQFSRRFIFDFRLTNAERTFRT